MIRSFETKGLQEILETGKSRHIDKRFHKRLKEVLDAINAATHTKQLDLPGYVLKPLVQFDPWRWSIRISAQWRVTFEFEKGDAYRVHFVQYH